MDEEAARLIHEAHRASTELAQYAVRHQAAFVGGCYLMVFEADRDLDQVERLTLGA